MSYLGRGLTVWRTSPGLMLLGVVPALIVAVVFIAGIVALGLNLEKLAVAATPFAAEWNGVYREGIRLLVALALLAVAVLFVVFTFTTVTLIVGQPLYERIWRHVESRYGAVPEAGPSGFWRPLGRGIADALRMLAPAILAGVVVLLCGLIPLVGAVLGAVLGALLGGWYLVVELTGQAFDARGHTLAQRRRVLRDNRPLVLGFGVATYLLFLLPLVAIVVMPAAVAGATLLSRRVLGEPDGRIAP